MPRLAFAYLRVSTRKQDEENQRLQITGYIKSHDLVVEEDGWFVDRAISGTTSPMERNGFRDMFETLEALTAEDPAKAPAHVVIYEISRLGRNFWEMLEVIKQLEEKWPIISTSPKESFLQMEDRSMRNLFLSILAWAAEREREVLVQRTLEGTARAKEMGRHSGNIPLGYALHKCELGVCITQTGSQCPRHGLLTLTKDGETALEMLIQNPKLKPRNLKGATSTENDYQRFALIRNVRKFGRPADAKTQ